MRQPKRSDLHATDFKRTIDCFEVQFRLHRGQFDGEIVPRHLSGQQLFNAGRVPFFAPDRERILRHVSAREKRKSLNVVPVQMSERDRRVDWFSGEFVQPRHAEFANSAAGIKDQQRVLMPHLDARCVAAVLLGLSSGSRN
jgi:hypothetical protein